MVPVRKLAMDPGFGGFKVAEVTPGGIFSNLIPASVGMGRIVDQGLLGAGLGRSRSLDKPLQLEVAGQPFLVGPNVYKHVQPTQRLDYQRLADGPELRSLVYAALSSRMNGGPYTCSIIVGLPVEVMQDRSLAQRTLASLRSWLVGEHSFLLNGEAYGLEVIKIRAMAQPLGSYWAFGLDSRGRWARSQEEYEAPICVVDGGFNTVDVFTVENGTLVGRSTGGERVGMHRAIRMIINRVRDDYDRPFSFAEADDLIRRHVAGKPALVSHNQGTVNVGEMVQSVLSQTFAEINEFVDNKIQGMGFRHLVLSGGWVEALRPWLVAAYPNAIILPDPVTANAVGLAKFAVREGVLD